MKKHLSTIGLSIVFIVGFLVLSYPSISNYINQRLSSYAIADYDKGLENLSKEDYGDLWADAESYNAYIRSNRVSFKTGASEDETYLRQLNVNNGMIGYIEIEKIGLLLPIYLSTAEPILQVAAGHLEGSSLPTGGIGNHTVLTGHRGLPSAKLFTDLDRLVEGDTFTLSILDRKLTYQVDKINIIEPQEVASLRINPDEDRVTLMTCTPYGVNTHRLLIHSVRIENEVEREHIVVQNDAKIVDPLMIAPLLAAPILLILVITVLFRTRKKKK